MTPLLVLALLAAPPQPASADPWLAPAALTVWQLSGVLLPLVLLRRPASMVWRPRALWAARRTQPLSTHDAATNHYLPYG